MCSGRRWGYVGRSFGSSAGSCGGGSAKSVLGTATCRGVYRGAGWCGGEGVSEYGSETCGVASVCVFEGEISAHSSEKPEYVRGLESGEGYHGTGTVSCAERMVGTMASVPGSRDGTGARRPRPPFSRLHRLWSRRSP